MDAEKVDDLLFQINGKLSSIEAKLDTMGETLLRHEARLTTLERDVIEARAGKVGFKGEIVTLLVKALVISLAAIATLTGATGIISKIFH